MVTKFLPELNKVYVMEQHVMLHILSGQGQIQVDFKNYFDWQDKIIFLEKGQYIRFLSENFIVRKIVFNEEEIFRNKEVRVLFKHLISLGYIDFTECPDCQKYLSDTLLFSTTDFIDISSRQWFWQNPFNADKGEYHVIFDVKDIVDQQFKNHLKNDDLLHMINRKDVNVNALISNKLGLTVKKMAANKRLLEIRKELAFSGKSSKEIAYEYGFKDPAYFNRIFKQSTGTTPMAFKKEVGFQPDDLFVTDLLDLLQRYHTEEKNVAFYANKMHLSVKTLSKKAQNKLQVSIGQLIRQEVIKTAKNMLLEGIAVKEVAYTLAFEEANHFSSFFKKHTGTTPTKFQTTPK